MKGTRKKVMFLCTGNSCRSQMAEAGVDITGQSSKLATSLVDIDFDLVVTKLHRERPTDTAVCH